MVLLLDILPLMHALPLVLIRWNLEELLSSLTIVDVKGVFDKKVKKMIESTATFLQEVGKKDSDLVRRSPEKFSYPLTKYFYSMEAKKVIKHSLNHSSLFPTCHVN